MPEIVSRKEAKARGLKRFFTGKPCERGHISEGWAWGMSCIECFKIGILQRYYANHEANKARLRENSARERREDPSKGRERQRVWRRENLEEVRKRSREGAKRRRDQNLEKARKCERENYRKNIAASRERQKRYALKNPQKIKDQQKAYRLFGPSNPTGELQWLNKAKASVRNLKRLLRHPNHDRSSWLSEALEP